MYTFGVIVQTWLADATPIISFDNPLLFFSTTFDNTLQLSLTEAIITLAMNLDLDMLIQPESHTRPN